MHDPEDGPPPTPQVTASASLTPYEGLTPHAVLDALDAVGMRGDGRILQLNSYENRVFQVGLEDGRFIVAKFYREQRWSVVQILEEHAFARELVAADLPVVAPLTLALDPLAVDAELFGEPPTLARVGAWRLGVTLRCAGRDPELEDPAALRWVGRYLARMHQVGQRRPYEHRLAWRGSAPAREAMAWLVEAEVLPPQSAGSWSQAAHAALDAVDRTLARVPDLAVLRIHGDMHRGNLLWRPPSDFEPGGPHFVDLDDTCSGPAVQDLWMLVAGSADESAPQLRELLAGYESLRSFDRRELGLIEALRTLRLILHSAWIARRWADPAFPVAFPGFDSPSWWSQQTTQLMEQIAAMERDPLRL